jgi:hypothetical protein
VSSETFVAFWARADEEVPSYENEKERRENQQGDMEEEKLTNQ